MKDTGLFNLFIVAVFLFLFGIGNVVRAADQDLRVHLDAGVKVPLGDIGCYKVGYKLSNGQERWFPDGWTGHFESKYGISWTAFGEQDGKPAMLMHSPWKQGSGVTFADYLLEWPNDEQLNFIFYSAIKKDFASQSDGVSYRVYVDGKRVFEYLEKKGEWTEHKVDISGNCSTPGSAKVRIEVQPGPANNPSFDYSLFGAPAFSVTGTSAALKPGTVVSKADRPDLSLYTNKRDRGTRPSSDLEGGNSTSFSDNRYVLSYKAGTGTDPIQSLDYVIEPADGFLSGITAVVNGKTRIPVFYGASLSLSTKLVSVKFMDGFVTIAYKMGSVDMTATVMIQGKTLAVDIRGDAGSEVVNFGGIGPVPIRRQIRVPYLFETRIYALLDSRLFCSTDIDWSVSNATSIDGSIANYGKKTDKKTNPVTERAYVTISDAFEEVLPNIPNPASPYLSDLAGRIMLDFWGGSYSDNADTLRTLRSYGVLSPAIIKHDWQRDGYDNALPNHVPANPAWGGDEGMLELSRVAKSMGARFSLHENYIDMYENSDYWSKDSIAIDSGGQKQKAWFNEGTQMQSFAIRPTSILGYAEKESPQVHKLYDTNAAYLDVHTCIAPSFHVDMNANTALAGSMAAVRTVNSSLFGFERKMHSGPLFGEGRQHFYWAGLVDGVEAQVDGADQEPILAEFDLLKIHPQMVNHGMGYMARWFTDEALMNSSDIPAEEYDKYRTSTLAYGHAGFIDARMFNNIPQIVKEYYLMTGVQNSYVTSTANEVLYNVEGRLVPISDALLSGTLDGKMKVTYSSGLVLWLNRSTGQWDLKPFGLGIVLPSGGFYAEGPNVKAGTVVKAGRTVDYAKWGNVVYVDGRSDLSDTPVDFGEVKTSGALILRRDKENLRVIPIVKGAPVSLVIRLESVLDLGKGVIKGVDVVSRTSDGKEVEKIPSKLSARTGELTLNLDGDWVNDYLIKVKK